jgi:hypothetical protein
VDEKGKFREDNFQKAMICLQGLPLYFHNACFSLTVPYDAARSKRAGRDNG